MDDFKIVDGKLTYRDWAVFLWTGWKSRFIKLGLDSECSVCSKPLKALVDDVRMEQNTTTLICAACDGQPNYIVGQLCAKKSGEQERYIQCTAGALEPRCSEYKRGDLFDIHFNPDFTMSTNSELLLAEIYQTFKDLRKFIDSLEDAA